MPLIRLSDPMKLLQDSLKASHSVWSNYYISTELVCISLYKKNLYLALSF